MTRHFNASFAFAWRVVGGLLLGLILARTCPGAEPSKIEFARDVAPILKRSCWECHGAKKQEGGLRLDLRPSAFRGGDSGRVIVPGAAAESELIARVKLPKHADGVMPAIGEPLAPSQIAVLSAWIDAGAVWNDDFASSTHWSYGPVHRPALPRVQDHSWVQSPIDRFILARIEQERITPSLPADRAVLLRRLYLDLTGLPPNPDDVDAFLADDSPNAYERVVDELLASPQFGVRWARPWLDYARYADSHGFQRDDFRDNWAYRDWVVAAFNSDMPFDQFTTEQLAGDLLPGATESQKIASGFNRNAPTNVEAGSDPEETRVNQVFDRVNTLGMVWLGTTLECCQCHDHKYDPFTQRDYYGLFAFFNNTAVEAERANPNVPGSIRFLGPEMALGDERLDGERRRLKQQSSAFENRIAAIEQDGRLPDLDWEKQVLANKENSPQEHVLAIQSFDSLSGSTHQVLEDQSILLSGEVPDRDTYTVTVHTTLTDLRAFKLEALTDPSLPSGGPGRGDEKRPNFVLNSFSLTNGTPGDEPCRVEFIRATADFSQQRFGVHGAIDEDPKTAWAINPRFFQPHWAVFETAAPLGRPEGIDLTFKLEQNFGAGRTIGRLRLSAITGSYGAETVPADVLAALEVPAPQRSTKQLDAIAAYRLKDHAEYQKLKQQLAGLAAELAKKKPVTSLVMQELDEPRPTAILTRGDFRNPGDVIAASTPASLHPFTQVATGTRPNRLDLARWLMASENPLVARVVANRWWSEVFGKGLVSTLEDFGAKGEAATHPELLDWLAVEYRENGWSLKKLLREIVLSATYRQSSRTSAARLARDDQNRWYARGPRFRLDAEAVRDNALAIAGNLSLNQSGNPIRPYQPDGIWVKVGGQRYEYEVSAGEQRYRRGLYVVWKRGAPYPSFVNFDASNRMACRVQRTRSNTPLQALTLLNDPVYVDAAKLFARRILDQVPESSPDKRIEFAFRAAVARSPKPSELDVLRELYLTQLAAAGQDPARTKELVGTVPLPPGVAHVEFAAWYAIATALLNLDETISKS